MKIAAVSLALILAAAGLNACDKKAEAATIDKVKIGSTVKNDVADLVAAFNGRDVAKAVGHDAADVVFMFHGAPNTVGPEQDAATTKQLVADPLVWLTLGNATVDVADSGEMAVYRTTYKMRFTDAKTKRDGYEWGNWIIGYKKQADGAWKIAWNVVSDTPMPGAAAPAAAPAAKK